MSNDFVGKNDQITTTKNNNMIEFNTTLLLFNTLYPFNTYSTYTQVSNLWTNSSLKLPIRLQNRLYHLPYQERPLRNFTLIREDCILVMLSHDYKMSMIHKWKYYITFCRTKSRSFSPITFLLLLFYFSCSSLIRSRQLRKFSLIITVFPHWFKYFLTGTLCKVKHD